MLTVQHAEKFIKAIVKMQLQIIGPLAIEQANRVPGVQVMEGSFEVIVQAKNAEEVLTQLVQKYEELFGKTSLEVCKDAIREIKADISPKDLPAILQ